jgi:hypothetical protein
MAQMQDTTQVEVKINNYDMYESNTTPHIVPATDVDFATVVKDVSTKWTATPQIKLIWTTRDNYEKIVSDSVKMLKEQNYLIVPILNYKSVFSSYMENKDQIEGWNRVFRVIFHSIIDIGGVLSQNKNKAFTIIMNCNLETVNLLTSNQLTLEQIMITRHILGKLIDPGNMWLGSKGMQLALIENDTTYSLIARKPGHQGRLNPDSSFKYLELLKSKPQILKSTTEVCQEELEEDTKEIEQDEIMIQEQLDLVKLELSKIEEES